MPVYDLLLRDFDAIEDFFMRSTGMMPGLTQLSRGRAELRLRSVELAGATLIWTEAQGRLQWRDQMSDAGGLHFGLAVHSDGRIVSCGREVSPDMAQVWLPDRDMDVILNGPYQTLDIGVAPDLVEMLGWVFGGPPLRRTPGKSLRRLTRVCQAATQAVRSCGGTLSDAHVLAWRDRVLEALEPALRPWLAPHQDEASTRVPCTLYFDLLRQAEDLYGAAMGPPPDVDHMAQALGVPRRTLFRAFRRAVGIGPRRYFEIKRLHALRSRLRRASHDQATVTAIAGDLGFTELGRLAVTYRRQFGESPSMTLRRN